MRFYFRIIDKGNDEPPDLTKVFTPVDEVALMPRPIALSTPNKTTKATPNPKEKNRKAPKRGSAKKLPVPKLAKREKKDNAICDKKLEDNLKGKKRPLSESPKKCDDRKVPKMENFETDASPPRQEIEVKEEPEETQCPDSTRIKKETESTEERRETEKVYTNITLNRSSNIEIVTKIQKTSKDASQIEVSIVDQNAKRKSESVAQPSSSFEAADVKEEVKTEAVVPKEEPEPASSDSTENEPESKQESPQPEVTSTTDDVPEEDEETMKTKFEFLEYIRLTVNKNEKKKEAEQNNVEQTQPSSSTPTIPPKPSEPSSSTESKATSSTSPKPSPPPPSSSTDTSTKSEAPKAKKTVSIKPITGIKRKNSSPIKTEAKRPNLEPKRTTKIILQQKPGYPPLNLAKPSEKPVPEEPINKNNRKELRSLFQNCRLNIPASLSITLRENGETSRQPVQMPPVQNFIEILKIDEKSGTQTVTLKREEPSDAAKLPVEVPKTVPSAPVAQKEPIVASKDTAEKLSKMQQEQHSFQKIFEASIKKTGSEPVNTNGVDSAQTGGKCSISEIAQQLYKKTKTEQDGTKPTPSASSNSNTTAVSSPLSINPKQQKIQIPRLSNQRVVKPPTKKGMKFNSPTHQTLTNLHSSSLGLNYTVSVDKQPREMMNKGCLNGFMVPKSVDSHFKLSLGASKPTAGFLAKPSQISPRTVEMNSEKDSPKNLKPAQSPRPMLPSPVPKLDPGCLPPPHSFSPKNISPKPKPKTVSPRPKSAKPRTNASPSPSAAGTSSAPALTANEILEKYNIQNLAQLSASMNFNAQAYLNSMSNKQMTTLHQTMLMKHMELQNRQSWFNINQAPLLQFEKYLQTLNASKNQLMGNLKDN